MVLSIIISGLPRVNATRSLGVMDTFHLLKFDLYAPKQRGPKKEPKCTIFLQITMVLMINMEKSHHQT